MTSKNRRIPPRRILSIVLGWLHGALVFAPLYAFIFTFLDGESSREAIVRSQLFGLLIVVPIALTWLAGRYVRGIVLYLLACAAIIACTVWIFGTGLMAIPAIVLCFFRFYNRITGERHSIFDHAGYPALLLFLIPAVASFFYKEINSVYQFTAPVFAAVYFLICFAQRGLERIDGYITMNDTVRNMPTHRIVQISAVTLTIVLVLFTVILLPPLLQNDSVYRYEPPPVSEGTPTESESNDDNNMDYGEQPNWMTQIEVEPNPVLILIFRVLEYILLAAVCIGAVFCIIFGALRLSRLFRHSFQDKDDLVENLQDDRRETIRERRQHRDRPGFFDRSPNAIVRRRYRRTILRAAKEPPQPWMTPSEAETHAKLTGREIEQLHVLYEKARYSADGCSRQDIAAGR